MAYPPITVVVILVYHCIYAVLAANNNKTCLNNWTNLCNNCEKKNGCIEKKETLFCLLCCCILVYVDFIVIVHYIYLFGKILLYLTHSSTQARVV